MRRRALLLLLLPLGLALWHFRPRALEPHAVVLDLGPRSPSLREADLLFQRQPDLRVARDLELRFPTGAPPRVEREVRLAPGTYDIGVRLRYADGSERHLTRTHATDENTIELDLR